MKIINFEWYDNSHHWHLTKTTFKQITLLVGPSGAGKTRILQSIIGLKYISNGRSMNGIRWNVLFESNSNKTIEWYGEFENKDSLNGIVVNYDDEDSTDTNKPKIINETLKIEGKTIFNRKESDILLFDKKTPKLSSHQSAMYIFKEEDIIKDFYYEFSNISLNDQSDSLSKPFRIAYFNRKELEKKYKCLEDILDSHEHITTKFYLTYKQCTDTFNKIKSIYIDIFPTIDDIIIEPIEDPNLPHQLRDFPFIQFKENGIDEWIDQGHISSGMFSVLLHLCELILSANGSIILIDEFENSLGVNCINDITNEILSTDRNLQFIITSHHPYIINEIDYSHWKIVNREAGEIHTHDAENLNIGDSKHESFLQLINHPTFIDGIK